MTFYINSYDKNAALMVKNTLKPIIYEKMNTHTHIVVLCIGTDRVTGDSLGPFVGDRLTEKGGVWVFGTIHKPVHAKNLQNALKFISSRGKPLVIAVDAALGSHIGHITIADEGLKPGTALAKELPSAGHIGITGIVNSDGIGGIKILQSTRLSRVMDMSEVIAEGIRGAVMEINSQVSAAI